MAKYRIHDFGENDYDFAFGSKIPVKVLPKYKSIRKKVVELIDSGQFNLSDGDFWILKNYKKDKSECYYSGLIISHDALVRVNDQLPLDHQFNQQYCSDPIPTEWNGVHGYRMDYRDKRDGMFEYGEISTNNCKNDYPYAMLLKRTFDRVVKRKAKLSMVYSDSEAEEFREPTEEKKSPLATPEQIGKITQFREVIMDELMARNIDGVKALTGISVKEASKLCKLIDERMENDG